MLTRPQRHKALAHVAVPGKHPGGLSVSTPAPLLQRGITIRHSTLFLASPLTDVFSVLVS